MDSIKTVLLGLGIALAAFLLAVWSADSRAQACSSAAAVEVGESNAVHAGSRLEWMLRFAPRYSPSEQVRWTGEGVGHRGVDGLMSAEGLPDVDWSTSTCSDRQAEWRRLHRLANSLATPDWTCRLMATAFHMQERKRRIHAAVSDPDNLEFTESHRDRDHASRPTWLTYDDIVLGLGRYAGRTQEMPDFSACPSPDERLVRGSMADEAQRRFPETKIGRHFDWPVRLHWEVDGKPIHGGPYAVVRFSLDECPWVGDHSDWDGVRQIPPVERCHMSAGGDIGSAAMRSRTPVSLDRIMGEVRRVDGNNSIVTTAIPDAWRGRSLSMKVDRHINSGGPGVFVKSNPGCLSGCKGVHYKHPLREWLAQRENSTTHPRVKPLRVLRVELNRMALTPTMLSAVDGATSFREFHKWANNRLNHQPRFGGGTVRHNCRL